MLYGKSGNEKYGRAENNGRASGRAASRAIRLRHQFSVLSSRFYLCVPLCTSVFPVVQALVLYHRGRRGTQGNPQAIRLRHQSRFSVLSFPRQAQRERRFFVATSPALFPASRRGTLSTIRHRLLESRERATRRLLLASRRIPLSYPLREPLPPSASPRPARRIGSQASF